MREKFCKYFDVISGYAFKSTDLKVYSDVPVIKIGNISNGADLIEDDSTQYVSKDFLKINEKYHINKDDILISLTGSHINQPNSMVGRVCRSYRDKTYLLNQRAGKVIPKDDASKEYLFYLLSSKCIKEEIVNRAYGAANQVNISPSAIGNIKWDFPSLDKQKKIGELLSFFDKLIIINNKRIKILEQMAENLYKEWFVRFRFPGHENAEFVDGVPKGWEYCKLKKIINISRGLSYTSEEIDCIDGVDLINLKNIQAFGGFNESGTKKYSGKYKTGQVVRENDLIMGVTDMTQDRRVVGSVALIPPINNVSVISADLIKILPNNISNIFLYSMFKYGSVSKFVSQFANGANVLHLRPQVLDKIKVLLPEDSLIEKYLNIITGFISEKNNLQQQNQNLIKQRDYLLPRLMSGKIQVE